MAFREVDPQSIQLDKPKGFREVDPSSIKLDTPEGVVMRGERATPISDSIIESTPFRALAGVGGGLLQRGVGAIQGVADYTGMEGVSQAAGRVKKDIDRNVERMGTVGEIGRFVGDVAPLVALPAGGATLGSQMALGAVAGAAEGATRLMDKGDALKRTENAGVGAVLGAAVPAGIAGIGKAAGAVTNAGRTAVGLNKVNRQAAQELVDQGITATRATTSDVNQNLFRRPFVADKIGELAAKNKQEAETVFQGLIKRVGKDVDVATAGEKIQQGMKTAVANFKAEARTQYDGLARLFNPSDTVELSNLANLGDDAANALAGTRVGGFIKQNAGAAQDYLRKLGEEARADGVAGYGYLKQLKTEIGGLLSDTPFVDPLHGAYKRAYGAVSRDLEALAQKVGGEAGKRLSETNKWYARNLGELSALNRRYVGKSLEVEQSFGRALSGAKGQATGFARLMRSIPKEDAKYVQGTLLRKLAETTQDGEVVTSLLRFQTNYNKLAGEGGIALKALIPDQVVRGEMDKFVRNIARLRPVLEQMPKTGVQLKPMLEQAAVSGAGALVGGYYGGWEGAMMGAVGSYGLNRFIARNLTNPVALKAVNRALEAKTPAAVVAATKELQKLDLDKTVRNQLMKLADDVKAGGKAVVKGELKNPDAQGGAASRGITAGLGVLAGGTAAADIISGQMTNGPSVERYRQEKILDENFRPKQNTSVAQPPARGGPEMPSSKPMVTTPVRTVEPSLGPSQGVSADIVDRITGVESSNNPKARNKLSNAVGLGQFIPKTWLAMVDKHAPELAVGRSNVDILKLRTDPEVSRFMTQKYVEDNARILEKAGAPVSDGAIYLAHFLGPQTAAKVLTADPRKPITAFVSQDAVSRNKSVLKGKKVSDVIAWAERKMGM